MEVEPKTGNKTKTENKNQNDTTIQRYVLIPVCSTHIRCHQNNQNQIYYLRYPDLSIPVEKRRFHSSIHL